MSVKLVDRYFSDTLKWTIAIGSGAGSVYLLYLASYLYVIFVLLLITLIAFSAKYVIEVNTEAKRITDSFYVLWIKTKSEEIRFNTLHNIRLDKERHTYNATTRSRVRQADFNEYIGTLVYDTDKSLELARSMEYQSIAEEMKQFGEQLNLPIIRTF
ncbi:MAG: hypothetical protein RI909_1833 [Bacteroidota bacterium]|jgi:hypothetical protein